jgi:hypothetical protein
MHFVCPKDPEHDRFVTTAMVGQEWEVERDGTFIKITDDCLEVFGKPDPDNQWNCAICGEEAEDIPEEEDDEDEDDELED